MQADPGAQVAATPPAAAMQGFDTFAASGRAVAVSGGTKSVGASNRCDYTVCTSTEKLMQALNISGSVSAEFGFGGIDAKAEFARQLETTSTSVVVAIRASVIHGKTVVTNPRLDPEVKAPDRAGLNAFYQAYGDSYLSAVTLGGEYIATYVFYSQTRTAQQQIVASLQAHGVTMSGNVTASIEAAVKDVASSEMVRVASSQQLFGYTGMALPQPDQMVAFALGLSAHEPNAPTVMEYEAEGYEHVPGMDATAWDALVDTRDGFVSSDGIAGDVVRIEALRSQIAWLRRVYRAYGYTLDAQLNERAGHVDEDVATLRALVRTIQRDPTRSYAPPKLQSLAYGLPALNVTTPELAGQWGGSTAAPWWDASVQTILDSAPPRQVTLASGTVLDRITTVYGHLPPVSHGGSGGGAGRPLVLEDGELISRMSGRYGTLVDYLVLTTTRGQRREGGGSGGGAFDWTVPAPSGAQYTVVVGFGGRAAATVESIGPMTSTFGPATWQGPSSLEAS